MVAEIKMRKVIDNFKGTYSSSAKVVDGTLILSLPDAITPSVWRLDLGNVKASALEVREKDQNLYGLVLSTPKGDVHDIAGFDDKNRAVCALMAVTKALEQAHGQIKPGTFIANENAAHKGDHAVPAVYKKQKNHPGNRWFAGIAGIILLFLISYTLINLGPKSPSFATSGDGAVSSAFHDQGTSRNDTGVPLSADEFLRSR
jgi:hypothetical protein